MNAFLEGDDRDSWNVIRLGYRPVVSYVMNPSVQIIYRET